MVPRFPLHKYAAKVFKALRHMKVTWTKVAVRSAD